MNDTRYIHALLDIYYIKSRYNSFFISSYLEDWKHYLLFSFQIVIYVQLRTELYRFSWVKIMDVDDPIHSHDIDYVE